MTHHRLTRRLTTAVARRPHRCRPMVEELESRCLLATFTVDFGDAPASYPTTLAENGAAHFASGPTLGANRDNEADGVHSANADADDNTGAPNDEDGVTFPATMRVGQLGVQITVNVQNAPSGAKLDAWIDFNGDGSWGGPGEQIAHSVAVVNGDNAFKFDVPSWSQPGTTSRGSG